MLEWRIYTTMDEIFEKLNECGIDTEDAIERFVGDKELYLKILKTFVKDPSFQLAEESFKEKKEEEFLAHLHSLKGVSGNLGISVLFERTALMRQLYSEGRKQEANNMMSLLREEYEEVVEAIKEIP